MDYSLEVLKRFHSPEGAGESTEDTPEVFVGEAEDRTLNVWVEVQVCLAGPVICTVRYQVFGCPHMVAAVEWVAEALPGRSRDALRELNMHELLTTLDAPLEKLGKLLVLEDALRACWQASEDQVAERNGS
ncbi:MAG: iron-sulfur cluster assembly scaffold protein [Candidatus Rariloculaceae bacterium]